MKKFFKSHAFGIGLALLLLLATGIFICLLAGTSLLPIDLLVIGSVILILLTAAVTALVWNNPKRVRAIIAIIIAIVLIIAQALGAYYIKIGSKTLEGITKPGTEFAEIGVFVRQDDPATKISDAKGYTFGILKELDRTSTDKSLKKLSKELEENINTKEFANIEELLDALLLYKDVNAILLNKGFLDVLEELEGYTDYLPKLRKLFSIQIEINSSLKVPEDLDEKLKDTYTVYISGIDCNGSISRRSRSDVNIIATVNIKTGQILLLSTPRDYYVPLSISNGIPDKLTHAGIYGIDVSRQTLEMLYDTKIDYYFRVNFDGFKDIIDALGGVTVISEYSFRSGDSRFQKGENYLNGTQALVFARDRYHLPGGDRQRGRNQMAVISAVIRKVASSALLSNYTEILDSLSGSFETDIPYKTISKLIQKQLDGGTAWNVVTYSADGTGAHRKPYSLSSNAYVMIPDQTTVDKAKVLINQVKDGQTPTP